MKKIVLALAAVAVLTACGKTPAVVVADAVTTEVVAADAEQVDVAEDVSVTDAAAE